MNTGLYYCGYSKNLRQHDFLDAVKKYERWSDELFVMISSNCDPFELHIGRASERVLQEY